MVYVGIDPGASGAIAIIDESGEVVELFDMPTRYLMPRKKREKLSKYLADGKTLRKKRPPLKQDTRRVVDGATLASMLRPFADSGAQVGLEFVSARSSQGVTSCFKFGESFGIVKGVLEALGFDYGLIPPKNWQGHFDLSFPKNSESAVRKSIIHECASGYYPDAEFCGERGGLKDGRSDALLIARYTKENGDTLVDVAA